MPQAIRDFTVTHVREGENGQGCSHSHTDSNTSVNLPGKMKEIGAEGVSKKQNTGHAERAHHSGNTKNRY